MSDQPNIFDAAFALGVSVFTVEAQLTDQLVGVMPKAFRKLRKHIRKKAVQMAVDAIKRNEEEMRQAEWALTGRHQTAWLRMFDEIGRGDWGPRRP